MGQVWLSPVPQLSRLIQGLQSRKANWQKLSAPPLGQGAGQGAGATIQTSKELLQSPPPPAGFGSQPSLTLLQAYRHTASHSSHSFSPHPNELDRRICPSSLGGPPSSPQTTARQGQTQAEQTHSPSPHCGTGASPAPELQSSPIHVPKQTLWGALLSLSAAPLASLFILASGPTAYAHGVGETCFLDGSRGYRPNYNHRLTVAHYTRDDLMHIIYHMCKYTDKDGGIRYGFISGTSYDLHYYCEGENPNQEKCNGAPIVKNRYFSATRRVRLDVISRGTQTFNLDNHFSDPDNDALSYSATSSHPDIVGTAVSGNTLTIASVGDTTFIRPVTITVTADDGKGGTVSTSFEVTVWNQEAIDESNELLQETAIEIGKTLATSLGPGKVLKALGVGAKAIKALDVAGSVKSIKDGIQTIFDGNEQNGNEQSSNQQINSLAQALYIHHQALQNGSISLDQAFSGQNLSIPLSLSQAAHQDQEGSATPPFNALLKASLDFSSFSDATDNLHYDGSSTSYGLGIDLFPNPDAPLLTGLQFAFTRSHSDFEDQQADAEGAYELNMFSLHPFLAWDATDNLTLWSVLGYGWPEAETSIDSIDGSDVDPSQDASHTSSGQFFSFAGGANYRVWQSDASALTIKLGGSTASMLDADFQAGRIAAQFSHDFPLNAGQLKSSADLALLLSNSDPSVAELSGSLNWLPNQGRLSGSTNARVLLFGGDRSEWGIGGSILLQPGQQGQGLSLALQPSFGQTNASLSHLHLDPFSFTDPNELALNSSPLTARFNAELAYGFPTANHALLTPYIDASLAHSSNTYTTGLRYQLDSGLDLDLSASHRTRSSGNNDNRLFLQLRSDL